MSRITVDFQDDAINRLKQHADNEVHRGNVSTVVRLAVSRFFLPTNTPHTLLDRRHRSVNNENLVDGDAS